MQRCERCARDPTLGEPLRGRRTHPEERGGDLVTGQSVGAEIPAAHPGLELNDFARADRIGEEVRHARQPCAFESGLCCADGLTDPATIWERP